MFERMETAEIIYECVVTSSCKKTTRAEANRTGLSRKIEEKPPRQILTPRRMGALASTLINM